MLFRENWNTNIVTREIEARKLQPGNVIIENGKELGSVTELTPTESYIEAPNLKTAMALEIRIGPAKFIAHPRASVFVKAN